jgi:hypothetical protein
MLDPELFWSLTFAELSIKVKGYQINLERQWEQTRYIASLIINVNVKKANQVTPEKLIPLSFDNIEQKVIKRMTAEELEQLKKRWQTEQ